MCNAVSLFVHVSLSQVMEDAQFFGSEFFNDEDIPILTQAANDLSACFPKCRISEDQGQDDLLAQLVKGTVTDERPSQRIDSVYSDELDNESEDEVGSDIVVITGGYISSRVTCKQESSSVMAVAKKSAPQANPIPDHDYQTPGPSSGRAIEPPAAQRAKGVVSVAALITAAVDAASGNRPGMSGVVKNGEGGFVAHDFSLEATDLGDRDSDPPVIGATENFISVAELARGDVKRTVPNSNAISFLVVAKKNDGWITAPLPVFHAVINRLEGFVMESRPHLRRIVEWGEEWRGCGLVSLLAHDLEALEEWRILLTQIQCPGFELDSFPRDCLLVGTELSILMKERFRHYDLKWLPFSIFARNTKLHGKLRVTHSKTYGAEDFTFSGVCKKGWRLVYLMGDSLFMESLKLFTANHGFRVGSGKLQIWGGIRRPMLPFSSVPRRNSSFQWRRPDPETSPLLAALRPQDIVIAQPNGKKKKNARPIRNKPAPIDCAVGCSKVPIKKKTAFKPKNAKQRKSLRKKTSAQPIVDISE